MPCDITCAYVGEKPFDTVEDLVQDGLITLYMEANNVEEYLQSARQTRIVHQTSISSSTDPFELAPVQMVPTSVAESPVFTGDVLSGEVEDLSIQGSRARRTNYQPCTIPQRRDRTNMQLHMEGEVHVVEGQGAGLVKTADIKREIKREVSERGRSDTGWIGDNKLAGGRGGGRGGGREGGREGRRGGRGRGGGRQGRRRGQA